MRTALAAVLLIAAAAPAAAGEVPFEPSADRFADAAGCKAHLARLAADERTKVHVAVEGPYDIAAGDVRIHWVDISGSGHRITEHRCLAEQLSARSWRHSMEESEAEAPDTIESMAAKAQWLKKASPEQK